jgi:hypothetical protein
MKKVQLMAGMVLSIVLAGSLTPMARALDSVPTPTASTVQEKGNHLADKAQPDKMAAKAVQLISEETHKPIANTSISIVIKTFKREQCHRHPCPQDSQTPWLERSEVKTDASGIIFIPRDVLLGSQDGSLHIFTKDGNFSNSVDFHSKEFLNQSGLFKVNLLARFMQTLQERYVEIEDRYDKKRGVANPLRENNSLVEAIKIESNAKFMENLMNWK